MTKRKAICILLAVMQLLAMAGCGDGTGKTSSEESSAVGEERKSRGDADDDEDDEDDEDADTSSETDEDGLADSEATTDPPADSSSLAEGGSQSDYDAAYTAISQFYAGLQKNDKTAILDYSDFNIYIELYKASVQSELDTDELLDEMFTESVLDSYSIGEGAYRGDLVDLYGEEMDEMKAEIAQLTEEDLADADTAVMVKALEIYPEIDMIYVFPFTSTADGETNERYIFVSREDGTWKVDMTCATSMLSYVQKSKITSANVTAKNIYNALLCAIEDMDSADMPVSLLGGQDYYFTGSDFENVTKPDSVTTADEALQMLKYEITLYYSSITKLDQIGISIDTSLTNCAAAVQNGTTISLTLETGEYSVFGSYPNMMTANDLSSTLTIENVIAVTKRE